LLRREFPRKLEFAILPDAATTTTTTAAPVAGRIIGIAKSYAELIDALKQRTAELGVTMETVDHVAGLPLRYCSKLLAPVPVRSIGATSLGPLLGALGLRIAVIVDEEQFERIRNRLTPRKAPPLRKSSDAFSPMNSALRRTHPNCRPQLVGNSEWSKVMNARRQILMSVKARRDSARHAARARWAKGKPAA
jgi:hypothetical protein